MAIKIESIKSKYVNDTLKTIIYEKVNDENVKLDKRKGTQKKKIKENEKKEKQ